MKLCELIKLLNDDVTIWITFHDIQTNGYYNNQITVENFGMMNDEHQNARVVSFCYPMGNMLFISCVID